MAERPDLDDLALLVLVARTGSLGRAASELSISQPSVSRRISRLERSLRIDLFERGPRGSVLTPSGRVVVDWADTLLTAADQFTASVAALRQHRTATLRVAASMTIAEHLAPRWISELRHHHPQVAVSLSVHNSTEVADSVESGQADLGFVESPAVRASLRRRRVGSDPLLVVVRPDHPWATSRRPIDARTLAAQPLLVREAGSGTRETLDDALVGNGLELIPALTLASNAALTASALAGIAPAVLSEMSVREEIRSGRLAAVEVTDLDLRRPLTVVWTRDDLPSAATALVTIAAHGDR